MAETTNIAEIASKISEDIFENFFWDIHQKRDDNFKCHNEEHASLLGKSKSTHPGDVVFHYDDPYLAKRIYLHTDLKSYANGSINTRKIRDALKSLCMTIECARSSDSWRQKYSIEPGEPHEVRGLLFVHNHDHKYKRDFYKSLEGVQLKNLPVSTGSILHFLGPHDIQRLYNIGNDMIRLKGMGKLPIKHTFYYPDLVLFRRQGDVWEQPATIENLCGPFLIIKYDDEKKNKSGYIIYYNRKCDSSEELEYFLDCLSRFQMLESGQQIQIRVTRDDAHEDMKSIFQLAKRKYVKSWGFDPVRAELLDSISIERITNVATNYTPGDIGWRE